MFAIIRSCRYCANNGECKYKEELRSAFRELKLEATSVVNCKRVVPYVKIGDPVSFFAWDGDYAVTDDEKDLLSGIVVGYVKDRSGHARTYVVKTDRLFTPYYESRDSQYWIDGESAKAQFPEVDLKDNEILVFVKYVNIQTLNVRDNDNEESDE